MNSASQSTAATPTICNYKQLSAALIIAVLLPSLLLPCLRDIGIAKVFFAYTLDGVVFLRACIAYLYRETGNGWKFYAWLLLTSSLWIHGIAYLVFGGV